MLGVIAFADEQVDELAAALGQIGQLRLLGRGGGGGLARRAVFGQHGGINGIGFWALALGGGEGTDAPGFDDADGNAGRLQGPHDRLFVTAGGFANDGRSGITAQAFEELGVAFGFIGQEVETTGEMQLQIELGNIEADVEDVWIVLTHTCGIRATMICGCRAQATVRVWDNGPRWNGLYDASRDSVCKGSTFSRAPSSSLAVSFKSAKQNN